MWATDTFHAVQCLSLSGPLPSVVALAATGWRLLAHISLREWDAGCVETGVIHVVAPENREGTGWNPLSGARVLMYVDWENLLLFSTWYFYSTWHWISPLPLHFESQRWRNRLLEFPFIIMALSHFCVLNVWPSKLSRNVLRYVYNLENYMVWFVSIVLQIFHWGFSSSKSARCKSIRILYF